MDDIAIGSHPKETNFVVWSAARRVGVAHKSADGSILVRLDAGEVVKGGNIFVLHPAR
jgi:hypothetical protein